MIYYFDYPQHDLIAVIYSTERKYKYIHRHYKDTTKNTLNVPIEDWITDSKRGNSTFLGKFETEDNPVEILYG